jgi:hypothetical protein
MADITTALDQKIAEIESQLAALKAARAALAGVPKGRTSATVRRKRKFTAAQRAEISRRMKATWAARRRAKGQK